MSTTTGTATPVQKHALTKRARELHRVTLNFTVKGWQAVLDGARATGHSRTDTINRAVQFYAAAMKATDAGGGVYIREDSEAKLERLHIL